jgi:5-methyltetrahydropteroyltriglutamate--homocysteine methyltransferase
MNKAVSFGMLLPTTVVGSYPVVSGHGIRSLFDPLSFAVKTAVEEQVTAGIDIISDGQVRGDMVHLFTNRLPGIKGQEVIGKVLPAESTITAADTKYALGRNALVKGIVTGPSSLAHALHLSSRVYRNKEELALDLSVAIAKEVQGLAETGVCMVQVDEPIFSTGAADLATGREALQRIASGVRIPVCLHVCGGLGSVIDEVMSMPVDIIDLEFAKNPGNLELLSGKDLQGKMLGYGCVDSSSPEVESTEIIVSRIRKGLEIFAPEQLLIDPDCGLRMQTRETAFAKLTNMVAATKVIRNEITAK